MIGFHLDDTEWDEKENCLRKESLYNTNDKTFERPNHNKTWVYNEKTGWSMKDKQENDKMHEIIRHFDNKEICESDMDWQEEMQTIMANQSRSCGAKSFKKKRAKRKMAKKSRRKNR